MTEYDFEVYIIRTIYAGQYVAEGITSRHINCSKTFDSQEEALEHLNEYWGGTGEIIRCEVTKKEYVFYEEGKIKEVKK